MPSHCPPDYKCIHRANTDGGTGAVTAPSVAHAWGATSVRCQRGGAAASRGAGAVWKEHCGHASLQWEEEEDLRPSPCWPHD